MKVILLLFLICPAFALSYVGSKSGEAILQFSAQVQFEYPEFPSSDVIEDKIQSQLLHLFGPMQLAKNPAVPKGDEALTPLFDGQVVANFRAFAIGDNRWAADYGYEGVIAVASGPRSRYPVILPIDPDVIYERGKVKVNRHFENPCTDPYYTGLSDFWYFWSPFREGCPLRRNIDYVVIDGDLQRLPPSTRLTYPEYHNLPDANGNIRIDILFGIADPVAHPSLNPMASKDISAFAYRQVRSRLQYELGFEKPQGWSPRAIRRLVPRGRHLPFVEETTKSVGAHSITIRLFYGPTGIEEASRGFHWFFKDAIETASVMIYSGHSGLGGHLDLDDIESILGVPIRFNKNRYQIFFFDSCTSYRYYNSQYFKRKKSSVDPKGTKNLDIWTNGLETPFDSAPRTTITTIKTIVRAVESFETNRKPTSYKRLAQLIDENTLFGINGDEDNDMVDGL